MTHDEFVTSISTRAGNAVTSSATAMALAYTPFLSYPNTNSPPQFDKTKARARLVYNAQAERQSSLGPAGSRKFETKGNFFVQIYAPAGMAESASLLSKLSSLILLQFSGVSEPNGVWYINVAIQDQAPSPDWFSVRVAGQFRYSRLV